MFPAICGSIDFVLCKLALQGWFDERVMNGFAGDCRKQKGRLECRPFRRFVG
jgi:hypothetical protein